MLRREYEGQNCSIARALEIIGERWTLLIIRDVFLGIRRFDELQESLGVARNVLTDRLTPARRRGRARARPLQRPTNPLRVPTHRQGPRPQHRPQRSAAVGGQVPERAAIARLLRRKADKKPVIAAFVPKGADVLRFDELELVPGPGLKVG
jgi:hypothetical protein